MVLGGLALLLGACGDDGAPAVTSAPPPTAGVPPATSPPPACADLAEEYLDTFFALGAGTPRDPEATTVRLPVERLLDIDRRARRAGCQDFVDVACSAYAELEAQGLDVRNSQPPATC